MLVLNDFYNNISRYLRPNGPLTRYEKLWVVHTPGMSGTFSPPPTSKETASYRSRHASRHVRAARAVMHVGIDKPAVAAKTFQAFPANAQPAIWKKKNLARGPYQFMSMRSIYKLPSSTHHTRDLLFHKINSVRERFTQTDLKFITTLTATYLGSSVLPWYVSLYWAICVLCDIHRHCCHGPDDVMT